MVIQLDLNEYEEGRLQDVLDTYGYESPTAFVQQILRMHQSDQRIAVLDSLASPMFPNGAKKPNPDSQMSFNVHADDADLVHDLIDKYGGGSPDQFLREAIRVLAATERAERFDSLRQRIAADLGGRTFTTQEVVDMSRGRIQPKRSNTHPRGEE